MIRNGFPLFLALTLGSLPVCAQTPPGSSERAAYSGLLAAAWNGDIARLQSLLATGENPEVIDRYGRTPFLLAAYGGHRRVMQALAAAGANVNAMENSAYDAVTIAAVANDLDTLKTALSLGNSAANVTSPYQGTALIAAAHLGHVAVVQTLIQAGAPLDHVNNLGWTAVIEAIVLGDGGPRHQRTLAALIRAGADVKIADEDGNSPLALARAHGYQTMVEMLEKLP